MLTALAESEPPRGPRSSELLIDALAKVCLPGTPEELIFRGPGHPTASFWKSTTLLHPVDADEHRIEERSCVCPHPTQ